MSPNQVSQVLACWDWDACAVMQQLGACMGMPLPKAALVWVLECTGLAFGGWFWLVPIGGYRRLEGQASSQAPKLQPAPALGRDRLRAWW